MSSSEILGWKEYFSIVPTMGERLDWIITQNAVLIKKGTEKLKMDDFLPDYLKEKKKEEKSLEEQQLDMEAFKEKLHRVRKEAGLE